MIRIALAIVLCSVPAFAAPATQPAFPGAEGFGAGATGGRGGEVVAVTNLNDAGPGSLRDAVSVPNRTVVFRVSGTIELKSKLLVTKPNVTIAGQTAPGDGICLRGHELFIKDTHDVVVRFLRSRPGDEAKVEHDAITIWNSGNVILDHCSLSWSTDSLSDVVKESGNVTVQWCLLAEPLNNSVHVKGAHGYATGWDGRTKGGFTGHHNLIAHAASRAPRVGYFKTGRGTIDVRNNVIYDSGPAYGGEGDDFNFVANYYRPGPGDYRPDGKIFHISEKTARAYFSGNVFEGRDDVLGANASAVTFDQPWQMAIPKGQAAVVEPTTIPVDLAKLGDAAQCLMAEPFQMASVHTESAADAFKSVVARAGALPRDAADARVINDVKNRTGGLVNTPGDVGGWPELKSTPAPLDADNDGMPDAWESSHGLNPNDAADGAKVADDGYTNLERYLNELAEQKL